MPTNSFDLRQQVFDRFANVLIQATEQIDAAYMQLPVSYQEAPIFRERVYCYELYHQLRCLWTDFHGYLLNGEVDKRGHRDMNHVSVRGKIPDLLVHRPGDMADNLIVIEVKPIQSRPEGRLKDLETIEAFLAHGNYFRGIYLIYGNLNDSAQSLQQIYSAMQEFPETSARAMLFWHRASHFGAESYPGSEIRKTMSVVGRVNQSVAAKRR